MPFDVAQFLDAPSADFDNRSRLEKAKARDRLFAAYIREDLERMSAWIEATPEQQQQYYGAFVKKVEEDHAERFTSKVKGPKEDDPETMVPVFG